MHKLRFVVSLLILVLGISCIGSANEFTEEDLAPITNETVYFRGWQFRTDVVQDNIARYNETLDGHVDYATVTGDYPALMETNLVANAPLDILYANPSQACRYYDGGWILPAEELPNASLIKADLYPNILDAWTYKDKLLGISYFCSVRGIVLTNLKKYSEAGMSDTDFPTTWDELYDQLYELRDKGIDHPYLPMWFNEYFGISWSFLLETLNRGGHVADPETHAPAATVDGPAGDTLRAWKRLWNDGIIPRDILSYLEPDFLEAWGSGEYVFSPGQLYDLKKFNDPHYCSFAGYVTFLPFQGQSWGLLDTAMYLMSNRRRSDDHTRDVMAAFSWYGYKDHEGEIYVGQRWMNEAMLLSGYKTVMESEQTEQVMRESLARPSDYDALLELYANAPYPRGVFNVTWSTEFNGWLRETLQEFLLNDEPVDEMINAICNKINDLNAQYGIGQL